MITRSTSGCGASTYMWLCDCHKQTVNLPDRCIDNLKAFDAKLWNSTWWEWISKRSLLQASAKIKKLDAKMAFERIVPKHWHSCSLSKAQEHFWCTVVIPSWPYEELEWKARFGDNQRKVIWRLCRVPASIAIDTSREWFNVYRISR